jgi:hypothetical protein
MSHARPLRGPGPRALGHHDGVRVAGLDAVLHGGFDAVEGVVNGGEQPRPALPVQSVGVGGEPQPCRPVGGPPAEPNLVDVVVDRDAQAAELGQVVDGPARGRELEVEPTSRSGR